MTDALTGSAGAGQRTAAADQPDPGPSGAEPASAAEPGGTRPLLAAADVAVTFTVGSSLAARIRHEQQQLRAVDGVSLDLARGEALALVGESGSGKSTLALALAGMRAVDRGEIRFDGRLLPARRSRADQRRIQMVFQDPYSSLNPRLTVGSMLRELVRVHDIVPAAQAEAYCEELLTLVGLGPESLRAYPRQFSGGQRQRVAIARALALKPDVLVADEPVSALDVSVQATILNLLRDLRADLGLTLMLISHNLAVVRHLCDRIAVMYLGRIVEVAPAAQLFQDPRHPYTRGLLAAIPRLSDSSAQQGVRDAGPAVAGDPPSALRIPEGCRFRTRCPIAQELCAQVDPELMARPSAPEHQAACHFAFDAGQAQPALTLAQAQTAQAARPKAGEAAVPSQREGTE
jgi:oligopeptide transport system ATP-binding protein